MPPQPPQLEKIQKNRDPYCCRIVCLEGSRVPRSRVRIVQVGSRSSTQKLVTQSRSPFSNGNFYRIETPQIATNAGSNGAGTLYFVAPPGGVAAMAAAEGGSTVEEAFKVGLGLNAVLIRRCHGHRVDF